MKGNRAQKHFDQMAGDFEVIKRKVIPGYRTMEKVLFRFLPFPPSKKVDILELGTGPGTLAAQLLRHFPRATYTGIDYSENMLEAAARRLKIFERRARLVNGDLNGSSIEGIYHLVVSLFTIHHVTDKAGLFKRLYHHLKPGGCLCYADVTVSRNGWLERRFIDNWKEFMASSGLPGEKIRGVIADHRKYDRAEPLETQLHYLERAGFTSSDILWSSEKSAVFFSTRGGSCR